MATAAEVEALEVLNTPVEEGAMVGNGAKVNVAVAEEVVATKVAPFGFELSLDNSCSSFDAKNFCI